MIRDWIVVIRFPELPEDADEESVKIMAQALLDSNGEVPYKIIRIFRSHGADSERL